jgi:hypothetical protein
VNVVALLRDGVTVDDVAKEIAAQPDVVSLAPYFVPRKLDERQNIIMAGNLTGSGPTPGNYLDYLAANSFTQAQFTASNFAVNVTDSGIDNGTQNPNHFALFTGGAFAGGSRVVYNRLEGTPNPGSTLQSSDGHGNLNGNLNTHIIAGFIPTGLSGGVDFGLFPHADASGFRYGLGVAPFVKVGSSVIFDPDDFTFPNLPDMESRAYRDRARISSNSWGLNPGNGAYTIDAQT